MHERAATRAAVVAQLMAGVPSVGSRVFKSRHDPLRTWQLPAITVYSEKDDNDPDASDSVDAVFIHTMTVVGWVAAMENLDDALDALALEIETAMASDKYLNGTASMSVLTGTVYGEQITGERPMGAVALSFDVTYRVPDRGAVTPTDAFEKAGVTTDLEGAQAPADRLTSVVTIPGGP